MNGAKLLISMFAAVIAFPLLGCESGESGKATRSLAAEGGEAPVVAGGTAEARFIDSNLFDDQLKQELTAPRDYVIVEGSALNVNELPPRLDKWLTAVKETGGTVLVRAQATDEHGKTRFFPIIGALLGAASSLWSLGSKTKVELDAQEVLDAAELFDAEVTYNHDTGVIREVKFSRRQEG